MGSSLASTKKVEKRVTKSNWSVIDYNDGTSGAIYETSDIMISIFKFPNAEKHSMQIWLSGDQFFVQGDSVALVFGSSMQPKISDDNFHVWHNPKVVNRNNATVVSLTASLEVLNKISNQKYMMLLASRPSKFYIGEYTVTYPISLKGSSAAINKTLTSN